MEKAFETDLRAPAYFGMARFLVVFELLLRFFVESRQQIEGDIGRLEVPRIGVRDVVAQASKRRCPREHLRLFAGRESCGIPARYQPGGNRFRVSLDARDLSGKENAFIVFQLQRGPEQSWRVDVGIPVHLSEA